MHLWFVKIMINPLFLKDLRKLQLRLLSRYCKPSRNVMALMTTSLRQLWSRLEQNRVFCRVCSSIMAFWSKVDHKQRFVANPDHLRIIKRTYDSLVSAAFQSARNVGHDFKNAQAHICLWICLLLSLTAALELWWGWWMVKQQHFMTESAVWRQLFGWG